MIIIIISCNIKTMHDATIPPNPEAELNPRTAPDAGQAKDHQQAEAQQLTKSERRSLKNERKRERKEGEQRKRRLHKMVKGLFWILLGLGIVFAIFTTINKQDILPPSSSRGHTEVSPQSHISAVPFSLNVQKHMLEHADGSGPPGVFINYNCEQFDCEPDFIDSLAEFVSLYPEHVYVAPYKNLSAKLVLTAEGRQEVLDSFDEQRIRDFIGSRGLAESSAGPTTDDIAGFRIGPNVIYLADQKPGPKLTVNLVTLAENGYVVIHETIEGEPGAIIGHTLLLDQGEHSNIEAVLERDSLEGEDLIAMLHEDNGDGEFVPQADQPIKDANDNVIFMRFRVSLEAEAPAAINL